LEAWRAAQPSDQQVAIALAGAHIAAGRAAEGRAVLESYGGPGMLTSEGQRALASCLAEEGRLGEADALLTHQVDERLPAFLEAQRAYQQTSDAKVEQWLTSARLGMERELEARLIGADQATSERIVGEWLRERAASDPELAGLRDAYTASGHVVAAVLSLGGIKLRRASESSGQERAARLREAERLFLSIRDEAEGEPGYHLSLGQVYHRLGRTDEGEAELRGVLDRNDPELTLSVAHAYRELGLVARSREVATALYESLRSGSNPQDRLQASQVAFFLTRLARNLEEEEQWLERSPQDSPAVQIELTRSRGQRALGERRLREADGLFAEVVRRLEEQGTADAAIVNNAALARVQRFECTGEVAHVDAAIAGLEHAVRLAPDNSLTLSNLAEILTFRARLRVLDRALHTASLQLDASGAEDLVDAISGDEGERLRAALRQDPAWRRAQEVTRQEQALAPRRTIGYGRAWSFIEGDDLEGLRALVA
ncbi:MAG: hypothetical protein K8H88_24305, partial [Sandaracinaceae bacterium]|nr:hypothetical protein [Sandaracinaceae bacterium]